jgi:hypothetical protein
VITGLTNRYASVDRTGANTNLIRKRGRRDSDNRDGSK